MITFYGFGSGFALPDPSPFVVKAEVLLKMAGLDYEKRAGDPRKAPKGKMPYMVDDGAVVPDSTLIRLHIERTRGFDFDKGLDEAQKGAVWAIEKMLENHVYWLIVHDRWRDKENFDKGPRDFFRVVPAPLRPLIVFMVRRQVAANLHGHGMGRYSKEERDLLGRRAIDALAGFLGEKPWLTGEEPCGADATAFAFVSSALCPVFRSATRDALLSHPNLVTYARRGMERWYPEFSVNL